MQGILNSPDMYPLIVLSRIDKGKVEGVKEEIRLLVEVDNMVNVSFTL